MPPPKGITVVCCAQECGQSFIFRKGIDYSETWNGVTKHFHRECYERGYDRLRRDLANDQQREREYE